MGEAVQQRSGEALRPEDLGPLVEGQVGGDQDGAPLAALAEDLEEQFSPGGGQGDEAQFVDDQQAEAGQLPLQVEQPPFQDGAPLAALAEDLEEQFTWGTMSSCTRAAAVVKPTDIPRWQAARPRPRAT